MTKQNATIDLGAFKMPIADFAIQGNSLLGIKETGKSSTAIYLAEQLLENDIPFVAFDQVGIWKNIKIPGRGKGYEVVVAGGHDGDLPLTPELAPEIVRAAMKNNIPLVLDLFDVRLSKAARRRIVEVTIEILLYENTKYGPRHIFVEEAPQVVPQRVTGDVAKVYGAMEEFCRMGGNSLLGYTLIGLRPEELNKAVLELCDCLILFRQKGRHSLDALEKWLKRTDEKTSIKIAKSIPTLSAGQCWIWPRESVNPVLTLIPPKNSFHPDRRNPVLQIKASKKIVDVSSFVTTLSNSLEKQVAEAKDNDPKILKLEISRLKASLEKALAAKPESAAPIEIKVPIFEDSQYQALIGQMEISNQLAESYQKNLRDLYEATNTDIARLITSVQEPYKTLQEIREITLDRYKVLAAPKRTEYKQPDIQSHKSTTTPQGPYNVGDVLTGPERKILDALAWFETIGQMRPLKKAVAILAGYSPNGGGFTGPCGSLRRNGYIDYDAGTRMFLTDKGHNMAAYPTSALTQAAIQNQVMTILDGPQKRILTPLLDAWPDSIAKDKLAELAGYVPGTGGFTGPIGRLHVVGIVDYTGKNMAKAADFLFLQA